MTTIISKRHPFIFYFSLALSTLFFIGLATALLFIHGKKSDEEKSKNQVMPILSIGCYAFAGYSIYQYFKNVPTIKLNNDTVAFNNKSYSLEDIEKVELTGKRPFRYVKTFPMEAATLTFTNGKTKYIFDDMYSNSWEIKSFLKQVVIKKLPYSVISQPPDDTDSLNNDYYEVFKGNPFTSLRAYMPWGLAGFFAYTIIDHHFYSNFGVLAFFVVFAMFCFMLFSYQLHYFAVSDNYFLVRNHNLFWKKRVYSIKDIKEVVFSTTGKNPNSLTIITKNFKKGFYPAGTLWDKTWLALKDKLEVYGIEVRNECIR